MDIITTNFQENLRILYESIESAEFISIDTEFTGLFNKDENVFDESDTLEERYTKMRTSCEEYWMCQLGICTFSLDTESNSYVARPFNVYTLPRSQSHPMAIHPSSMKFLVENGFDMNKLFKYGLNCTRIKEAQVVNTITKNSCYKLGLQSEEIVMDYVRVLIDFLNSKETTISIDVPSRYVKKLLQGPSGALKHFKNLSYAIIADEGKNLMKISKNIGKTPIFVPPQVEKVRTGDEEILESLGATLIFAAILKARVPLVMHNCLFDIGYLYTHFVDQLANTLNEFKNDIISLFPSIYDTKNLARSMDMPELNRLNLEGLYRTCIHSNQFKNTVRYGLDEQFQKYNFEDKAHEAAYDAFITGVIFLHLREYNTRKGDYQDLWKSVNATKNRICLNKSNKHCLNLNVPENNLRNENIFKVKVLKDYDITFIAEYLARFGDLFIRKIVGNEYVIKFDKYYDNRNAEDILERLKEINWLIIN